MPAPSSRPWLGAAALLLAATTVSAEGPFRNRDNKDPEDAGEGTYPVPYQLPKVEEVNEVLGRVRAYLDAASATRVIDRETGAPITDFSEPNPKAVADRGEQQAFNNLDYTMGVVHSGMLLAGEATGDARFRAFTARHLEFIGDRLPYFRAQAAQYGVARNSFRPILEPAALDDSGSMCAALIKARLAGVGPDLQSVIEVWADWVHRKQFRLVDGTLARQRPQAESLWSDDFYMSIPALAQMGRLTGDRAYFDEAVRQVLQLSRHLFNRERGTYMHGRNMNQPDNPEFYWARANGWAMMSMVELLEVLPADHPGREQVLEYLRAQIESVATLQSGSGLWHQMLDKADSYLETSASAMFVYSMARAINRGWISAVGYGSVAQAGWNAITTRVNPRGQVEGSCVGTTFASDHVYYYNRPATVYATHGYGPVLLAGAEMIRLLQNDRFRIESKLRTYHYVPKAPTTP